MNPHLCSAIARLLLATLLTVAADARAADDAAESQPWYERAAQRISNTWNEGEPELYVPLHIHHVRSAYSQEKIDSFNESPWGLGIGKGTYDEDGDWHGLYMIEFKDSHYKPEYLAGYGYTAFWPVHGQLKAGVGYLAFLTTRSDIGHYTPFPLAVPTAAVEYAQKYSFNLLFVPGGRNNGNVFIFWGKVRF